MPEGGQASPLPPAMPSGRIDCMTCADLYRGKPVRRGLLGDAPNKYCYRKKCYDTGVERGHIHPREGGAPTPIGGGGSGSRGGGPEPMTMGRDAAPAMLYGAAQLYKIHSVYGFRYVLPIPHCPLAPRSYPLLSISLATIGPYAGPLIPRA